MKNKQQNTPDLTTVKRHFLATYKQFTTATEALRACAKEAVDAGATRKDFVSWLREAGLTKGSSEVTASRIMGMLDKKKRTGRPPGKTEEQKQIEKQAKGLFAYVKKTYGKDNAARLLRAALKLATE